MSERHDHATHVPQPDVPPDPAGHGGHSWMMIACCIPMVIIAVALVATGVVGPGFLILALACTAMMALMMRGMHSGGYEHEQASVKPPSGQRKR